MPLGQRAGHRTHWIERSGLGAKVIFAHCSLGHCRAWSPIMDLLPGQPVVALDLPDHGKTDATPPASCPQDLSANILIAELRCGDQPAHLVGHSFGGTASLLAALRAPDQVASLTLIEPVQFCAARGTAAHMAHERALQTYLDGWNTGDRRKAAKGFLDVWGDGPSFDAMPHHQQSYVMDRIHVIAAQGPALNDDRNGILNPNRLETFQVPTTFIEGSDSPPIAAAIIDHLEQRIPNSTRHSIENAGHMLPMTHALTVSNILTEIF